MSRRARSLGATSSSSSTSSSSGSREDVAKLMANVEKLKSMMGAGGVAGSSSGSLIRETIDCPLLGLSGITYAQCRDLLGGTRVVLLCGPPKRARALADMTQKLLKSVTIDQIGSDDYFTLLRVGPILCVSHGMGSTSVVLLMNELWSLLRVAIDSSVRTAKGLCFIRVGSSGGVGVDAGTLVVTQSSLNPYTLKVR